MEIELEPRVKKLSFKVKGVSRESPSQKASFVLDTDLRSHWSAGTNTKEWILLELDEPCLLSHLRIYNKSVLEWEISVGLRYKPETFVKVRPRCEAPRRDMIYPMNYTPCRYVRISCLRGNPIAIFFIQLIGVSVSGLEPEFQPVINHLLPNIVSHKQDTQDMHLQLLQDMTNRLLVFLPQLEADLANFSDAADQNLRFLAMLAGPWYPILHIVNERETARSSGSVPDSEVSKNSQLSSSLTVSSNFQPRRSRGMTAFTSSNSSSMVFRSDAVFILLRKAYKESYLGTFCRTAASILYKLTEPVAEQEVPASASEVAFTSDEIRKTEALNPLALVDYSSLLGEEFHLPDDNWDLSILNVLDIGAIEEGILHVLYSCASQPILCHRLAESTSEFWSALPLVQALLPALRPSMGSLGENVDDTFSHWQQPFVQQALSQIVAMSCSPVYRPLLHACAGYLSSYSPSHAKAACVLIDLCSSVLGPWMAQVIAKVDLTVELLEDLLGTIQGARHSPSRARAALKYVVLALSGHMDDILGKYKEVKHKILFLLEMLEPFIDPAIYAPRSTIAFGDVSFTFMEKQEKTCVAALNIIRIALQKPAVLSSLESEWRRGSVTPSVLLSILEPRMQLPPEIDLCKSPTCKNFELEASTVPSQSSAIRCAGTPSKSNSQDDSDGKVDTPDNSPKVDVFEDASLLFAPAELRTIVLTNVSSSPKEPILDSSCKDPSSIEKIFTDLFPNGLVLDADDTSEYFNLQADYFQLVNYRDCELRASEFRRLALDLHSQNDMTVEGHDAAVDALLLAAECYVNPFFMMSFRSCPKTTNPVNTNDRSTKSVEIPESGIDSKKTAFEREKIDLLEKKRDKIVLQILLEAAELDRKFHRSLSNGESVPCHLEDIDEQVINLTSSDVESADAVTLIRQNQALLFSFVIRWLKKEQHSMHEILMHCLIFLLHSATHLYCAPEEVIDIILGSAKYLNAMLTSFYHQSKEGNLQLDLEKIHGVQRRWALLQRLVISSGGGEGSNFAANVNNRYHCGSLIPPSAWVQRISIFSTSSYPLVRFLGWMAISRNAEQFIRDRIFLAPDLSQLTCLLSIFSDELSAVDNVLNQGQNGTIGKLEFNTDSLVHQQFEFFDQQHGDQSFRAIYSDLYKFFPNLKKQFEGFGEHILEAVGLQLQSLSSTVVPDILCWFSDVCSWQFLRNNHVSSHNAHDHLKGYVAKNAKAIILYILEAIVVEHMEAIVPEMPRVVQVLVSLCRASYCDVPFLESIMCLLKPLISYSLSKVSDAEKTLVDDQCLNFESLCFQELFGNIRQKNENGDVPAEKEFSKPLIIFILASVFPDLSFQRRRDVLHSLTLWADFTSFEPTTSFHDYLCSFQTVMESCKVLLVQTLKVFGFLPIQMDKIYDINEGLLPDSSSEKGSWFLSDMWHNIYPPKASNSEKMERDDSDLVASKQKDRHLSMEEIEDFSKGLENILTKLNPTLELCWNLHHRLVKKLVITSAECFAYSICLSSIHPQVGNAEDDSSENSFTTKPVEDFSVHWRIGIRGLADVTIKLLANRCWEITSLVLDCLLGIPSYFQLDNVMDAICYVIKSFSCCAPKIVWRLRSGKWLSMLFSRGTHNLHENETPLTDLFGTLLGHAEPEQRFIALKHLARLVGQAENGGAVLQSKIFCNSFNPSGLTFSVPEPFLPLLVSSTWDQVVLLASSDTLQTLRIHAMTLLVSYMPYASQHHLRSFLAGAGSVLHVLGKTTLPTCEGPLLRLALALVAGACLYSSAEDIFLIPHEVWSNIERIGLSRTGGKVGDLEKNACEVLCNLRNEGDQAKEALREVLYSNSSEEVDSEFGSTREAILQVISNLTSVHSYFEIFSEERDEQAMELEEAEMELGILLRENAVEESSKLTKDISSVGDSRKNGSRLQEIKDRINSLYVLSSTFSYISYYEFN